MLINLAIIAALLIAVEVVLRLRERNPPQPLPPTPEMAAYAKDGLEDRLYVVDNGRVSTAAKYLTRPDDPDRRGYVAVDLVTPKAHGQRRIALVGSSPMRGGTQPGQSTAESLRLALQQIAPDVSYQVVDTSLPQGFADNVAWTITQLAPIEPDVVVFWPAAAPVIFADVERRLFGDAGARSRIDPLLEHSRTYGALREMLQTVGPGQPHTGRPSDQLVEDPAKVNPPLATFMRKINAAAAAAYADFLETGLQRAADYRAQVIVVVPPTCLACRDPLFSVHAPELAEAQAVQFAKHLAAGEQKLKAGDVDGAIIELTAARDLDPTYARARYQLGVALRRAGRHDQARAELAAAVEHDASVETIKEPTDASTREIAARAGARLFDLETFVVDRMPDAIVDHRAMIDLTHLTLDMQWKFAEALAKQIHTLWP